MGSLDQLTQYLTAIRRRLIVSAARPLKTALLSGPDQRMRILSTTSWR